jgi:hypothetical protein
MNSETHPDRIGFTFSQPVQFVPWDCVATTEDGRRFEGPVFLMGTPTIEPRRSSVSDIEPREDSLGRKS